MLLDYEKRGTSFDMFFREMKDYLLHNGVRTALTAWTYWNRLSLKRKLKKTMKAPVTRERTLSPVPSHRTKSFL